MHLLQFAEKVETPSLVLDLGRVRDNYLRLKEQIPVEIYYAIKANPHPDVLRVLVDEGSGFDVASWAEIELALAEGAKPTRLLFSNVAKSRVEIAKAYEAGILYFAFDCQPELAKLRELAPICVPVLRLSVANQYAAVPLSNKFGASSTKAKSLMELARMWGFERIGLTFHVGSQCLNPKAWQIALAKCERLLSPNICFLGLGGGLPVPYTTSVPSIKEIAATLCPSLESFSQCNILITIEPGRFIVADAGIIVATVILEKVKDNKNWLFLDVGAYNGLQVTLESWDYEIKTLFDRDEIVTYYIAGPSCHSRDIIFVKKNLPKCKEGDRIFIINAGAYTFPFVSNFCGSSRLSIIIYHNKI